jgi:hypothetical protein
VHTVGRGLDHAVTCTVGVDGYIGGRIKKVLWFGSEGDGMCCTRIFVGPFDRVARVNRYVREKGYTPSRATTLPARMGGATQIGSKRTFQIKLTNGLTSSRVQTTFAVHV